MPGRIMVSAFLKRMPLQSPSWAGKLGAVLLGVGFAALLRTLANQVAPGVSPYAFIYPASLSLPALLLLFFVARRGLSGIAREAANAAGA